MDTIITYMGRDIETMDAPELRLALRRAYEEIETWKNSAMRTHEMHRLFARARHAKSIS